MLPGRKIWLSTLNPAWKKFLTQSGAILDQGVVKNFGDPLAEGRAASGAGIICDLSHRGLIAVEGEDALPFLQGQLTCDLSEISATRSRLAAWCSPKGRVLVLFRVVEADNGFLLELPLSQIDATLKRLGMYVLRARVSLKDISDDFVRVGLAGESATRVVERFFEFAPQSSDEMLALGDSRVIRLHGSVPRFQFVGNADGAEKLWHSVEGTLIPAGHQTWSLLEIFAGVPEITTSDEHLPQMINLDVLEGVSFNKGCFVGQEVIARTHHLGRLKRRMYLISTREEEQPPPGAPIIEAAGGSEAGQIVRSAPLADGKGFAALAVLRIDAAKGGRLHLGSAEGAPLELLELPYSVPVENG